MVNLRELNRKRKLMNAAAKKAKADADAAAAADATYKWPTMCQKPFNLVGVDFNEDSRCNQS